MKLLLNTNFIKIFILLLSTYSINGLYAQTTVFDFEAAATSNDFLGCGGGFGGGVPIGIVADPIAPTNMVFEVTKTASAADFAGICTTDPAVIDLSVDHQLCIDFYTTDASGTLRIKLEEEPVVGATLWEYEFVTSNGWGTYCIDTNTPSVQNPGVTAAGNVYDRLVVFPDFGAVGTGTDETYYFDDVTVSPVTCDLIVTNNSVTCDASTAGIDTYTATFDFNQPTAPGVAGTYTLTTTSGGTIGGDDPDMMASGTITITGISEGTNADINITGGTGCNISTTQLSPACTPPYDITFQVDMCEQIANGGFDPTTQSVFVTGGNANQTGNYFDCGMALTDANMDGVYEITNTYPDGYSINYKFLIGDQAWANTGACTGAGYEQIVGPCGNGDRNFVVSGSNATIPEVCYASCTACTTCSCDLSLIAGTATCDALTGGVDTYEATFTFSQTTAPGVAGTYTLTTTSGGTIGGDDPDMMTSGTITISGIPEGTDADLALSDNMNCNLNVTVTSPVCAPSYNITFQVDMCEQIANGGFDPATQAVFVTGGAIYPNCDMAMTDGDMDGVYDLTRSYLDGTTFNWKYLIGDPAWANTGACTGAGFEANLPAPCGFGAFSDRQHTVNGMDETLSVVCFSSCDPCTSCVAGAGCTDPNSVNYDPTATVDDGSCEYMYTFNVDTNCPDFQDAPPADQTINLVGLTGPIFGWCGGCNDMTNNGSGVYTVTLQLQQGLVLEYKYQTHDGAGGWLNQEQLVDDVMAGGTCAPVTDGANFANRQITLPAMDMMYNDVFGSCDACPVACPPSLTLSAGESGTVDYESSGNISSTSIIASGAMIDYDSATDIDLNPDFEVVLGAVFCAFIDGCGGAAINSDDTSNLQQIDNNIQDNKNVETSKE